MSSIFDQFWMVFAEQREHRARSQNSSKKWLQKSTFFRFFFIFFWIFFEKFCRAEQKNLKKGGNFFWRPKSHFISYILINWILASCFWDCFLNSFFSFFFKKFSKNFQKFLKKNEKKSKNKSSKKWPQKPPKMSSKTSKKLRFWRDFPTRRQHAFLHGFSSVLVVFGRFCSFPRDFCLSAEEPAGFAGFKWFLVVFSSVVCVVLSFFPLVFRSLRVFFFCCALFCSARAIFFCFTSTLFVFCFSKFRLRFREFLIFFPKFFNFLLEFFSVSARINPWENDPPWRVRTAPSVPVKEVTPVFQV